MKTQTPDLSELLAREQAIRRETEILRDANIALTQNLSLETILETLLDYLSKLVPYDSANVMLRSDDSQFVVSALRRYEHFQNVETTRSIAFDENTNPLLRRICRTKQSVVVADTNEEADWEFVHGADHVRNWMGVPLVASGNVIGLYSVDKTEPGFFKPEHARLAETLAARAASAIQNAQLFEQSQMFSRQLIEAQEDERRRISRELHDQIGQILTAVKMNLYIVHEYCAATEASSYVRDNIDAVDQALRLVRDLSIDLRPPVLDDLGLVTALRWYIDRYSKRTGLEVAVIIDLEDENERFSREVETTCFRIAQEALTNIARHAQATEIVVQLAREGNDLVLSVKDDGVGFDLEKFAPRFATLGIVSMQERAHAAGGDLAVSSNHSRGTEVRLTVALEQ